MRAVDDRAIGIGAAIGVGIGLLVWVLHTIVPSIGEPGAIALMMWASRAIVLLGKIVGGFVAGWIARRDGALHGALVGAVIATVGIGIGVSLTIARAGAQAYGNLPLGFWVSMVGWAAVGIAAAAGAGLLAVKLRL